MRVWTSRRLRLGRGGYALLSLVVSLLTIARYGCLAIEESGEEAGFRPDRKDLHMNAKQVLHAALDTAWTIGVSAMGACLVSP
jgi:hypothetical protein